MNLYILGGGTLGRFIADTAGARQDVTVAGYLDDRHPEVTTINGTPVVGRFADLDPAVHRHVAIGVGEPTDRKRLFEWSRSAGCLLPPIVHPHTVLSPAATVGDGVIIGPYSTVLSGSRIGDGCCLLAMVNINQDVEIQRWCLIGASCVIGNGAVLEEGSHLGMGRVLAPAARLAAWSHAV